MVITLVCLVGAGIIFFQFVRPAYTEAQAVRADVIARQQFLEQQASAVQQVQSLIEKYKSDPAMQDTVSKVVPSTPDVGGALYQITAIAQSYGIQIISTTAQTPQLSIAPTPKSTSTVGAVRPLGVATFQVKFVTSYDNLKTFIQKLESNVRLMDVTAISVIQSVPGSRTDGLTVDLSVATYYQVTQ